MKKVKKFCLIVIIMAIMLILGVSTLVQATTTSASNWQLPVYFGIRELKDENIGYAIGDPKDGGVTIWDLVKYNDKEGTYLDQTKINIYCVKGGIGFFASNVEKNRVAEYNVKCDMQDIAEMKKLGTTNTVVKELVNGNQYNNLLALLDLLYLPGESSEAERNALLASAGLQYEDPGPEDEKSPLTDNDIEAIQQAAIWHFTNNGEDKFDKFTNDQDNWLYVTNDGSNYTALNSGYGNVERDRQAIELYKYLINTAINNASKYEGDTVIHKHKVTFFTSNTNPDQTQPLVVIEKNSLKFDLALRKYITKVNETPVTDSRVPIIDETPLQNDDTTATYKHPKDPVTVKTGDKITYNITIYNEGQIEGRATKVVDQLPAGLKYVNGSIKGNFEVEEYNEKTNNTLKLKRKIGNNDNLSAYTKGSLISDDGNGKETIEIECEVTAVPDKKDSKALTNVAWISEERDKYGTVITDQEPTDHDGADRDSKPATTPKIGDTEVNKDNIGNYKETSNNDGYYKSQEDDEDFEKASVEPVDEKSFDLRLLKRITELNGKPVEERLKNVDITALVNGTASTITYEMEKEPLNVKEGDLIKYTFRVYNEGEIDGYASEITENIPKGLEFLWSDKMDEELDADETLTDAEKEAIKFNQGIWTISKSSETSKVEEIKTDVLAKYRIGPDGEPDTSHEYTENLIKAFDKTKPYSDKKGNQNPDYREVSVILKVVREDGISGIIRNEAEISGCTNSEGETVTDRDSDIKNWGKENDNRYYDDEQKWSIYKEDDEDYDNVKLEGVGSFDLALKKFVTKIGNQNVDNTRIPIPSYDKEKDQITYECLKNSLTVATGDIVIYTIRVYNEGEIEGYAKEITDDIPNGLKFLPTDAINTTYRWKMIDSEGKETEDVTKAVKITTDYLSKEQGEGNLLKAFDKTKEVPGTESEKNPDYKDVQVAFRVNEVNSSNTTIINSAQISDDSDKNGNPVEDRDSKPGEWNDGEDDQDQETIKLKGFDLALKKFVTKVGDQNINTRIPTPSYNKEKDQIEYEESKNPLAVDVEDVITYTIRVYNEGEIDGYAKEITDDISEGLKFLPENETNKTYRWKMIDSEGKETEDVTKAVKIKTDYLSKEQEKEENGNLLKAFDKTKEVPGTESEKNPDYKDVQATFQIIEQNGSSKNIINSAQISDDSDKDGNPIEDKDSKPGEWNDGEDDQDQENVKFKEFDLALKKFVTKIGDQSITTRIPTPSYNKEKDQIEYEQSKNPLVVGAEDVITYTMRVYNEGEIDGYAKEITDDISEGLKFLPKNETNKTYRWKMIDSEGKETEDVTKAVKITTDYLSKEQEKEENGNLLKAFDKTKEVPGTESEKNPDYKDVQATFQVIEKNGSNKTIMNLAQISDDSDKNGNPIEDKDSKPGEWNDGEDDQDQETIKLKEFDLALKKFVTKIGDQSVNTTTPTPSYNKEKDQIEYEQSKEPLGVGAGNIITYTIRVYNEGEIDGYAKEITDDISEGLKFLPENETNKTYKWKMIDSKGKETKDANKAVKITTDYLSKEQEKEENGNLLKAFDKTKEVPGTESERNPDYKDVQVTFQAIEKKDSKNIINSAQISDDSDKDGNPVEDKDSKPGEWNEGEDDQDSANVVLQEFDLSLKKWVTRTIVIEDGKETVTNTGYTPEMNSKPVVKVDIHRNKVNKVTVKIAYSIRVTNEGDIAGYAKEIKDYVPQGLKFVAADNKNWKDEGNNVISTRALENTLLQPGEYADVEVVLTWIGGKDNMGLKINTAEISEDYNDKEVPDKDSTPNNKNPKEDDTGEAQVLLSTMTGKEKIYYTLGITILLTVVSGIVLIKKFTL